MKVVKGDFGKADADNLLNQVRDLVYSAKGRISVAEALGIIEILKFQIYKGRISVAEALGIIEILKFQIYEDQTYDDRS